MNDDTTLSDDNRFQMIASTGGSWALQAKLNNRYVTANNAGGNYLSASKTSVSGNWERFHIMQVFDMWPVFTAFGNHFPNSIKWSPNFGHYCKEYSNMDYYTGNTDTRQGPRGFNVWDVNRLAMIGDWECIVITGTYEFYGQNSGADWVGGIPRVKRYTSVYAQTDTPQNFVTWNSVNADCSRTYLTSAWEWYRQYGAETWDFGGDVGRRWVIRIGYKDTNEQWLFDLGPSAGNFSPRYGCLQYSQAPTVFNFVYLLPTSNVYNTCYAH